MKKLFFLLLAVRVAIIPVCAQVHSSVSVKFNTAGNTGTYTSKFYFPVSLFGDSIALDKALTQLADQVITAYNYEDLAKANTNLNKADFYDTAFHYQMIKHDYKKAIALIDSARKFNDWDSGNSAIAIEFESYAQAKSIAMNDGASFKETYLKKFKDLYNHLSDNREKIWTDIFFDSANVKFASDEFHKVAAYLKSNSSDSINIKDAHTLLYDYNTYTVYSTVLPLARPFLNSANPHVMYPLIKSHWAGVVPVSNINELPDRNVKYKLLIELTSGIKNKKDSFNINNINGSFSEVARKLNLHLAAGIAKKNIDVVVVMHGPVLYSLLNNENYRKKYNVDNPNLLLLKDLKAAGVKFIACGQAMFYFNVKKEEMIPGIKVALSAQTVLSTYQLKNYVYYDLSQPN